MFLGSESQDAVPLTRPKQYKAASSAELLAV